MNFKEWLNEMTRWKRAGWKRPPVESLARLKKYNKQGVYCHFSQMPNKIGFNPGTIHTDTPYGIYAYPIKYVLENEIVNLPYAEDLPFIWIFKAKNAKRIRHIRDRRDKNGKAYTDGYDVGVGASQMAKYFLSKGINGFVDHGTSTIHPSEPTQAVFFGLQTIDVLDVINNTTVSQQDWEKKLTTVAGPVNAKGKPVSDYDFMNDFDDDTNDFYDPYDDPDFQTAYGKSPWE